MRQSNQLIIILIACVALFMGCNKRRNFYEDTDDPGLSRLTSRGYDIITCYVNGEPYINPYQHYLFGGANTTVSIQKIETASAKDTLRISCDLRKAGTDLSNTPSYNLAILVPVEKGFSFKDFEGLEGRRFPYDSTTKISIQFSESFTSTTSDSASIYFIKTAPPNNTNASNGFSFSGLFEGKIEPATYITKGRFDFMLYPANINF
jgi:hypothetical protein